MAAKRGLLSAEECRKKAEECRALARQSGNNSEHRRMLEQMAESWSQLAETTEKETSRTGRDGTAENQGSLRADG